MRKKIFKARKALACSLALSLVIATPITPPQTQAAKAASRAVTVSTQKQLNKALSNKKAVKIIISPKTKAKSLSIKKGNYSKKSLDIRTKKVTITVKKGSSLNDIKTNKVNSTVNIKLNGKAKSITVSKKSKVSVTGSTKSPVSITGNAANSTITTAVESKVTAIGNNTKIIFAKGADNSTLTANAEVNVTINKNTTVKNVQLNKNNANTSIKIDGILGNLAVNQTTNLTITGSNKSNTVSVKISSNAASSTVNSAIPIDISTSANVNVKLSDGSEGSNVTADNDDVKVDIENNSNQEVDVKTPEGTGTVNTGETGSTSGDNSVIKPSAAPATSVAPSAAPSAVASVAPSAAPSAAASAAPSAGTAASAAPSAGTAASSAPSTGGTTGGSSSSGGSSYYPPINPSTTAPTAAPTVAPPTATPTDAPTVDDPTKTPATSASPSAKPSASASTAPTESASTAPTESASTAPSESASAEPTEEPSPTPTPYVTKAPLADHNTTSPASTPLIDESTYTVSSVYASASPDLANTTIVDVTIKGEKLVKHEAGGSGGDGYWVGIGIPTGKSYWQGRGACATVPPASSTTDPDAFLDEKKTIATFYFDVKPDDASKKGTNGYVLVENKSEENAKAEGETATYTLYRVDFSQVFVMDEAALAVSSSPVPIAANLEDHSSSSSKPSPLCSATPTVNQNVRGTSPDGVTLVDITVSCKELQKHTNGGGMEGYWIGIGIHNSIFKTKTSNNTDGTELENACWGYGTIDSITSTELENKLKNDENNAVDNEENTQLDTTFVRHSCTSKQGDFNTIYWDVYANNKEQADGYVIIKNSSPTANTNTDDTTTDNATYILYRIKLSGVEKADGTDASPTPTT